MKAPKCRTCGEHHTYGPCPQSSRGGGESRPTPKPPTDSLARQQRLSEVPVLREEFAVRGGAAGGVLKAPIAGVASGPRGTTYSDLNVRREYMRDYMRKRRAKK